MTTPTCDLLRRLPFLREIQAPVLERIAFRLPERTFPKGRVILREGEPCPGFWIVKRGSVNIFKLAEDGRMQILQTCLPGGVFALVPALDGGPCPASAETREESTLVFFPREDLLQAMEGAPEAALAVARTCAARLRSLTGKLAAATLRGVRARVAAWLAEEASARGVPAGDGSVAVGLGGPQIEVARRLGTVREVLARALRALEDDGLIRRERGGAVRIPDVAALRRAGEV